MARCCEQIKLQVEERYVDELMTKRDTARKAKKKSTTVVGVAKNTIKKKAVQQKENSKK